MSLDTMTKAEAEKLPTLEEQTSPEAGSLYRWEAFSDDVHTFFVRPVAAEDDRGCLVDVFGIRDGLVKSLGRERFIRQDDGKLRLLDE
ncbi:hypothetical protein [Streptomyces sp. CoT10]|uniref:hypothetical protein n=1 Tax=Streptomyces sp. CoT10 TaxID=2875762 RepID=UPI001CD7C284|nr:hypothetical protein [Streptomyces sp. CoT10]